MARICIALLRVICKDRMKLYQHSIRCSAAMQIFLDANSHYWRFVLMVTEEAEAPLQSLIQGPILTTQLD